MSYERYLQFVQELLTMVARGKKQGVGEELLMERMQHIIGDLYHMCLVTESVQDAVCEIMFETKRIIPQLCDMAEQFAGIPGDFRRNEAKRRRLGQMLEPGC